MLIQEYQESWIQDFQELKNILEAHISVEDMKLEHIGSTSVKGLAAKAIIDIDIVYEKPASFEEIKRGLEGLAYYHNGDQGIIGREVFKRQKNAKGHIVLDSIKHHLYVCHIKSEELSRHLVFRDFLRANEQARKEYETLKYRIAEKANQDRKTYAKLKEGMAKEFIESILKKSHQK